MRTRNEVMLLNREELLLFGERIRKARNMSSFTQEHVSTEIGISLRFYQMIERGEKSLSLDTLMKLGKTLNISIDYLLYGSIPDTFSNPLVDIFNRLSTRQKDDATQILQLYLNACLDIPNK
ncbi:helix-turn-helix domain-containing protein [Pseudoflavonifractor sp. BIOML-A6]|jgi:transcriptional regulator|nr:helix-turn-helix transcriptional regulator [Bacteroides thetaiotaomicron]MTQ96838.1 helix-turn-helix domain-containing protein [Pseudoflavonifractor sp. BIOML-A16]MTR05069.1 helix-turn-helix domain-containing protein [Pseudoflavonifractor sp. BIOML-A15]MTR12582.1 helix-turn-helix domain-containing protein [Pseudoflavonifractor sp. BIOML-A17]MTR20466.1 helix-turn-helix domain-containing protein [Pseudoflavonifractor sp. BIOML-A19]MTR32690.1 helix-turn-helix domain-containing protein [Pseudof